MTRGAPRGDPRVATLLLLACAVGDAGCRKAPGPVAATSPDAGVSVPVVVIRARPERPASPVGPMARSGSGRRSPVSALADSARSFARAYHLDRVVGDRQAALALYREAARGAPDRRETALAHLRLASLARARRDRAEAVKALDWLVSHARAHPALARRAERELVDLLHPQAGVSSVLTRGPLVSFTRLAQVDGPTAAAFRAAEQGLLHYVRVGLTLQIHNMDQVLDRKRLALTAALRRYDPLVRSAFPNAQAAALFRQGSLHQDFAEALGRARVPEELLPRMAARIRGRLHGESVLHFRRALERYRRVLGIRDVSADRWRRAAADSEARIGRVIRRR